jgi:1-deoxy-D-xylulose-5-phosphate reductoisomerase
MVEFVDGSILAQMSVPDMKLPILYALSYPERYPSRLVQTNVAGLPSLTFEYIDPARYPLYFLGLEAGRAGGVMPTVINAANEAALQLFMQRKIGFNEIYKVAAKALEGTVSIAHPDLETIIETNTSVYNRVINSI